MGKGRRNKARRPIVIQAAASTPAYAPLPSHKDMVLFCVAAAIGIAVALVPQRDAFWTSLSLLSIIGLLVHPLLHARWITEAKVSRQKLLRGTTLLFAACAVVGGYGWRVWPVKHRHILSEREKRDFSKALNREPKKRVQLACTPFAESDCIYAAQFIALFGQAGWDVVPEVQRMSSTNP